ncbi:hypothetical protein CCZ01_05585 [Helicobacter monodelphidis]|nr:hypothetical protein CCZ01_05585 [Helicobacter sp. 15-1451]
MVYLTQTDTTIGFLSQNMENIMTLKKRKNKPILMEVYSLRDLQYYVRVPHLFKNRIRRGEKTSYLYPNKKCLRVSKNQRHNEFLRCFSRLPGLYSSSANKSGQSFDIEFATEKADVIVYERNVDFSQNLPSRIFKINTIKIQRIR